MILCLPVAESGHYRLSRGANNNSPLPVESSVVAATTTTSPVQASIADCLACSGCVTTAETVLLEEQHSLDILRHEFMNFKTKQDHINASNNHPPKKKKLVVTMSPASWSNLLRHMMHNANNTSFSSSLSYQQKLATLLQQTIGATVVLDGTVPLQWGLRESARVFCAAYRSNDTKNNKQQQNAADMDDDDDDDAM